MTQQQSALRKRMIEDMVYRNMSVNSQKTCVRAVANFSAFHGRSPDKLTQEDVRAYRNHLITRGLKPTSINPIVGALRFFYGVTLGQRGVAVQIPYARKEDTLPEVLAREEVVRLLKAERNLKMRTALITIYATGLRVSEVVALKVGDIDSTRMVINVRRGKGHKDRYVMLSEQLLHILRKYWRCARPDVWLFPGPDPSKPVTTRSIQRSCQHALALAGIDKTVTAHTLRHSFATHLLEEGVDIRVIQDLLGHRQIASTTRYTRVAVNTICKIQSPLELLDTTALVPG